MEIIPTSIPEVILVKPDIFSDDRGYFYESYHLDKFAAAGISGNFVQDNESKSQKGVLRGLHYQSAPFAQGKLVRVINGAVLDVAVDIRKNSPTFGEWVSMLLSAENKHMCWIPAGFAHGFLTLENDTIFSYKCTEFYNRSAECSIRWNDPDLKIRWEFDNPILSEKDRNAPFFKNAVLF